uniref:Putative secreted protein n=1 Tax=Anopheles marajoara TaxID=58244 RepID=A0A2M4CCN7_9DIPT
MSHLILVPVLGPVLDQILSVALALRIPQHRILPSSCCILLHSFLLSDEPYVFLVACFLEMNQKLVLGALNLVDFRN